MKKLSLLLIISVFSISLSSCIHEQGCDSYLTSHSQDGDDSQIRDVSIYIYTSEGGFLAQHNIDIAKSLNIECYRRYGIIKVVAWGNTLDNPLAQSFLTTNIGSSINDHSLIQNLTSESFASTPLTYQISDIFYGATTIDFASIAQLTTSTIYLKRVVASYKLTITNSNKNYKVVVRHPKNGINFNGTTINAESVYMPQMSFDPSTNNLTSDINFALPTDNTPIRIEIYLDGKLIQSITNDNTGNPIHLTPNELQNILIDLSNNDQYVNLVPSEWGEIYIFENFN